MGNTDSKSKTEGPAGQSTQALNHSPSYTIQDGCHLFELHGGTSIKFILVILVVALIALAIKLGVRKQKKGLTGHHYTKPTGGDPIFSQIPMGTSRTSTYSPVPTHQHRWVDQQALDLRLIEQQRMFEMMFCNAMRTQQTARVTPLPRAQIFEVPVEQPYPTFGYKSGKTSRWPDHLIPQQHRTQTQDPNLSHDPRAPEEQL